MISSNAHCSLFYFWKCFLFSLVFSSNSHSPPNPEGSWAWLFPFVSWGIHRSLGQDPSMNWMGPLKLLVLWLVFQLTKSSSLSGMGQEDFSIFPLSSEECLYKVTSQWFLIFASFLFSICCMWFKVWNGNSAISNSLMTPFWLLLVHRNKAHHSVNNIVLAGLGRLQDK